MARSFASVTGDPIRRLWGLWFMALLCSLQWGGWADCLAAQSATEPPVDDLPARFEQAQRQGAVQLGQRPVYLQSTENPERLEGEVLALIDHPVQEVRAALGQASAWCDILILHLNVKYCRVVRSSGSASPTEVLEVGLGRKYDEPLASAHWLRFRFRTLGPSAAAATPGEPPRPGGRLPAVELLAPEGPLDTRDIRIGVQTVDAPGGRTLLQLRYAYAQGPAARWAMQLYLATVGRHKQGFSLMQARADDTGNPSARPVPVTGVRGLLERNTVRYYLAIDAYLDALALPPAQQLERRLQDWFTATERHPAQLHELDWETYVQMKRIEVRRQQSPPPGRP